MLTRGHQGIINEKSRPALRQLDPDQGSLVFFTGAQWWRRYRATETC